MWRARCARVVLEPGYTGSSGSVKARSRRCGVSSLTSRMSTFSALCAVMSDSLGAKLCRKKQLLCEEDLKEEKRRAHLQRRSCSGSMQKLDLSSESCESPLNVRHVVSLRLTIMHDIVTSASDFGKTPTT